MNTYLANIHCYYMGGYHFLGLCRIFMSKSKMKVALDKNAKKKSTTLDFFFSFLFLLFRQSEDKTLFRVGPPKFKILLSS